MRAPVVLTVVAGIVATCTAGAPGGSAAVENHVDKKHAVVTLEGPSTVRDEHRVVLRITWRTRDGKPLSGRVTMQHRRGPKKPWSKRRTVRVRNGKAAVRLRPRRSFGYRIVAPGGPSWRADLSPPHRVWNKPRIAPVRLPKKAPRPRVTLPKQPRASKPGLAPRTTRIPRRVWRSMKGRSWHRGCPVGRKGLRLIRMNYWGFDGYRHRGQLVVRRSIAKQTRQAFRRLYRTRHPIRRMYRVDRFGWSKVLQGANDFRSMAADNTSAFNCRSVVGKPGVRSPHSLGRSIDINPWENPYRSAKGYQPNSWWNHRKRPRRVVWRGSGHPVVKAMRSAGFGWLGSSDWHHFQIDGSGRAYRHRGGVFLD